VRRFHIIIEAWSLDPISRQLVACFGSYPKGCHSAR